MPLVAVSAWKPAAASIPARSRACSVFGPADQRMAHAAAGREEAQRRRHVAGAGERLARLQSHDRLQGRHPQPAVGLLHGPGQRRRLVALIQQFVGLADLAQQPGRRGGRRRMPVCHRIVQHFVDRLDAELLGLGDGRILFVQRPVQALLVGRRVEHRGQVEQAKLAVVGGQGVGVAGPAGGQRPGGVLGRAGADHALPLAVVPPPQLDLAVDHALDRLPPVEIVLGGVGRAGERLPAAWERGPSSRCSAAAAAARTSASPLSDRARAEAGRSRPSGRSFRRASGSPGP